MDREVTKRIPPNGDRDVLVPKTGKTAPQGYPILRAPPEPESWEGTDGLTPISDLLLPDPIEDAANRIEHRAEAIRDRPGPTPPPEALQAAITIHGVRAELHEFKRDVKTEFEAVHRKVDGVADIVVKGMAKELDRRRDQDHLVFRQKTEVGTATDIARIDVDAAKAKGRAEVRSKFIIALLSVAVTALGLLEALR